MAARGCGGSRTRGGVYLEVKLAPVGLPLAHFLIDPPRKVDAKVLGLSPIGVSTITDKSGLVHVIDWVGEAYYPNVADFVEEVRRLGLSRRISSSFDFSQLGPGSNIILVHRKAFVNNHADWPISEWHCPKFLHADAQDECCAGIWWHDVEGLADNGKRQMPSFAYYAQPRPDGLVEDYSLAAFASFPISNIAVVKDKGHEAKAVARASKAKLPVEVVDE